MFDTKQSGCINVNELKAAFFALGFKVKKEEIRSLLSDLDKEGAHTVTLQEFTEMVLPKILSRDPEEEILKVFDLIDEDGTGGITFENLKKVSDELGEAFTDQELRVSQMMLIFLILCLLAAKCQTWVLRTLYSITFTFNLYVHVM